MVYRWVKLLGLGLDMEVVCLARARKTRRHSIFTMPQIGLCFPGPASIWSEGITCSRTTSNRLTSKKCGIYSVLDYQKIPSSEQRTFLSPHNNANCNIHHKSIAARRQPYVAASMNPANRQVEWRSGNFQGRNWVQRALVFLYGVGCKFWPYIIPICL